MKEIEVNEYVRTKNEISKVIENVDKYVTEEQICVDFISGMYHQVISKHRIIKHSKQLIDLIENADILKIKISEEWVEKQDAIKFVVVGQTYTITEIKSCLEDGLFEIIQILTHEQFESNCYKVGGEDE
jgi:hypothetical protein